MARNKDDMAAKKEKKAGGKPKSRSYSNSKAEIHFLSEPEAVYELSLSEKINKIRTGISKKELEGIKKTATLDYDTLSWLLSVARATLLNKKGKEKFNSNVSEKILALADLYSYGYEVFEDKDKFNSWMKESNLALGNKRPVDLADTLIGIAEIKHLLGRIEYGVYS